MPSVSLDEVYGSAFPDLKPASRTGSVGISEAVSRLSSSVVGALPDDDTIFSAVTAAADKYGVPREYGLALANQESGYNPKAVGPMTKWGKAQGMFQFLEETAAGHKIDPFDPVQASDAAMKDFSEQMNKKGIDWAIKHHFGGPDERIHGAKTRQYLADVQKRADDIRKVLPNYTPKQAEAAAVEELGLPAAAAGGGKTVSIDEVYAMQPTEAAPAPKPVEKKSETGEWYDPVLKAGKNTFDGLMNRIKEDFPALRTQEEQELAARGVGVEARTVDGKPISVEPAIDRQLRWQEKVTNNPDEIANVPKDLLPKMIQEMPQVKGFINNLENPLKLLLDDSLPANVASYYANLPELARAKFDEARRFSQQENIVANPGKFPAVSVQAAQRAIEERAEKQDPKISEIWQGLKQAAKEDPGKFGATFVNAMMADPYMLAAPIGMGVKPIQAAKTLATGASKVGKVAQVADKILDAGATAGILNAGITAGEGLANAGEINKKDVAFSAAMGAAIGGLLGPIFMRGARAKGILADTDAAKLAGTYEEALRDAARADIEAEAVARSAIDPATGKPTAAQQRINEMLGIRNKADQEKFIKDYRKQVKDTFASESDYADYLGFKAQERIDRSSTLAAEAAERAEAREVSALRELTADAAYTQAQAAKVAGWRESFDAAVSARDADKAAELEAAFNWNDADKVVLAKMDVDEAMDAAWTGEVPAIKRALNKVSGRDKVLGTPKWQRGEADPKLMARLGVVGLGGAAGYALAPEGEKELTGVLGGLAGLLIPAGGSVLSRMRQAGAISLDGSLAALPLRRVRKGMTEAEEAAARTGEQEMIASAKAGDQKAMKAIYEEYFPYIKRVADRFLREAGPRLAIDAEDVAQETMIKVFNNLESFEGNSEFSTWVHAIAKNQALNTITKSKSRPNIEGMESTLRFKDNDMAELGELPSRVEEVNPATYDTPENFAILEDVQNQLSRAFEKMPEDIKLTVILKELEGFTEADIAAKLGVPIGTVKSRLSRGRDMIEEGLTKGWGAKRGQKGEIDPKLLKYGAAATVGAGVGLAFTDPDKGKAPIAMLAGVGMGLLAAVHGPALAKTLRNLYGASSTTILNRAPKVYRAIQGTERRILERTHKAIDSGHPFFQALRKQDQAVQDVVARALMTGDPKVISKVLTAVGDSALSNTYKGVRTTLDSMGAELEGLNMIKRTGIEYFPRMVVDKEGLFKAIGKVDENNLKEALRKANIDSIKKNARTLNAVEESSLINKILFTDKRASQPSWAKDRGIEEITPELQKFYAGPQESFNTYIRQGISEMEKAKFFGKYARKNQEGKLEYTNVDKSVGKMMADEVAAGMDSDTAREVGDIIKARFGPGEEAEPALIRDVKNIGNIGLLGNFWSALTQAGDVGAVLYTQGLMPTIEGVARKITGKKNLDMRDFGLEDHIAEEFANQRKTATWVNKVFKATFFSGMDRFGKDITLNAAVAKARNALQTDVGVERFRAKYGAIFGDDTDTLIKDIQKGNFTSEVSRDFAFMELARFQPISRIEYPKFYLEHPNFRSYLWLQSWTMKQLDLVRRESYNQIKAGKVASGVKNLVALGVTMGAANTSVEAVKAYLLGKEPKLDTGTLALNIFKNFGWSEYDKKTFTGMSKEEAAIEREEGNKFARRTKAEPMKAVGRRLVPPYRIFEEALRGDPKAIRYLVPGIGPYLAEQVKKADELEREYAEEE